MVSTTAGYEVEAAGVDPDTGTHRFEYDSGDTSPCMAVVSSLASVLGVDAVDLEPIHTTVEPDALNALVGKQGDESVRVTWTHEGHVVTVDGPGVVTVAPVDPQPASSERAMRDSAETVQRRAPQSPEQ
ncbi:HalOD1 output domain-containing protein [Halobacterium rubrum]|uniref:HalOD1 output domain-containing protein n=1 Tax=Halobacterium TaxID=2239 RepID=UPI001F3233D0|nr:MULTISPECIES: HalOD1 output domain-containing protein [Halobacterium]MDH5020570.1 hypothetical protein [Halobacterium rubrum]